LYESDKSTVAEHSIESSHWIRFHETEVLAKTTGCTDRLVKEAIAIILHLDNINGEEGFKLGKTLNPSTSLLRHSNKHASRKS
jgi:hypothetical protein